LYDSQVVVQPDKKKNGSHLIKKNKKMPKSRWQKILNFNKLPPGFTQHDEKHGGAPKINLAKLSGLYDKITFDQLPEYPGLSADNFVKLINYLEVYALPEDFIIRMLKYILPAVKLEDEQIDGQFAERSISSILTIENENNTFSNQSTIHTIENIKEKSIRMEKENLHIKDKLQFFNIFEKYWNLRTSFFQQYITTMEIFAMKTQEKPKRLELRARWELYSDMIDGADEGFGLTGFSGRKLRILHCDAFAQLLDDLRKEKGIVLPLTYAYCMDAYAIINDLENRQKINKDTEYMTEATFMDRFSNYLSWHRVWAQGILKTESTPEAKLIDLFRRCGDGHCLTFTQFHTFLRSMRAWETEFETISPKVIHMLFDLFRGNYQKKQLQQWGWYSENIEDLDVDEQAELVYGTSDVLTFHQFIQTFPIYYAERKRWHHLTYKPLSDDALGRLYQYYTTPTEKDSKNVSLTVQNLAQMIDAFREKWAPRELIGDVEINDYGPLPFRSTLPQPHYHRYDAGMEILTTTHPELRVGDLITNVRGCRPVREMSMTEWRVLRRRRPLVLTIYRRNPNRQYREDGSIGELALKVFRVLFPQSAQQSENYSPNTGQNDDTQKVATLEGTIEKQDFIDKFNQYLQFIPNWENYDEVRNDALKDPNDVTLTCPNCIHPFIHINFETKCQHGLLYKNTTNWKRFGHVGIASGQFGKEGYVGIGPGKRIPPVSGFQGNVWVQNLPKKEIAPQNRKPEIPLSDDDFFLFKAYATWILKERSVILQLGHSAEFADFCSDIIELFGKRNLAVVCPDECAVEAIIWALGRRQSRLRRATELNIKGPGSFILTWEDDHFLKIPDNWWDHRDLTIIFNPWCQDIPLLRDHILNLESSHHRICYICGQTRNHQRLLDSFALEVDFAEEIRKSREQNYWPKLPPFPYHTPLVLSAPGTQRLQRRFINPGAYALHHPEWNKDKFEKGGYDANWILPYDQKHLEERSSIPTAFKGKAGRLQMKKKRFKRERCK